MVLTDKVRSFFQGQLAGWQLAAGNYSSLELAEYRTVDIESIEDRFIVSKGRQRFCGIATLFLM